MNTHLKILLIEDSPEDAELLELELMNAQMEFTLRVVDTRENFIQELENFNPEVILSDHSLPSFNSMEALGIVRKNNSDIPFILVTGTVSEEFAVASIKAGADDYILKGSLMRLPSAIHTIFGKKRIQREKEITETLLSKLQHAYKEIEEKNKALTDSINYAKRIQDAIFPPMEIIKKMLPNSFILFKPKDIVSGDFYWIAQQDRKIFIAAADCTGHGVPGAFMSILGYNLLSKSVTEHKQTRPDKILDELSKGVYETLRQTEADISVKDGMDIAICTLNLDENLLEYAGAFNPLYIISDGKLIIIPAHRFPIGIFMGDELQRFTNHQITIKKGDTFYMFSDGYADQFGGPRKKKFKPKQLQELILSIQHLDMNEQKEVLEATIEAWKADEEQVDDILIIGVRY